ncbi:MAG: PIN domain nuclease, partial [Alkalibacterium sp.]|nr:PIN domain nuclease [Alkalibacterium sp.]
MVKKVILLTFVLVGGSLGYNVFPGLISNWSEAPTWLMNPIIGMVLGAGIFYIVSLSTVTPIKKGLVKIEKIFSEMSTT